MPDLACDPNPTTLPLDELACDDQAKATAALRRVVPLNSMEAGKEIAELRL